MGVGGPPRSTVEFDAGGVLFSLSFIARASSSWAILASPLADLGRVSSPTRFVEDFFVFGFSGDGSRDLACLEGSLFAILDRVLKADFVGDLPLSSLGLCRSSRAFLGDRGPGPSCWFCCSSARAPAGEREMPISKVGDCCCCWIVVGCVSDKAGGRLDPSDWLRRCMNDLSTEDFDL